MLIGSIAVYLVLTGGMCLAAFRTDGDGCVSGLILMVLSVLELFEIGRLIVNPVDRSTVIAMLAINTAAMIFVIVLLIINRD